MPFKNILILSFSQAVSTAGAITVVLLGGIIGNELAPSPSLVTLPIACMVIGVACTTIPASHLMKKVGRRNGFIFSAWIACLASFGIAFALAHQSFWGMCLGIVFIGSHLAFVHQYRFAAAESVSVEWVSRAQSNATSGVARVSLEDGPGEPVVLDGRVDGIAREVTTEVDGTTKGEDVKVILLGGAALVEHGGSRTRR